MADIWQLGCCFATMSGVSSKGTLAMAYLWTILESFGSNCLWDIGMRHARFIESACLMMLSWIKNRYLASDPRCPIRIHPNGSTT